MFDLKARILTARIAVERTQSSQIHAKPLNPGVLIELGTHIYYGNNLDVLAYLEALDGLDVSTVKSFRFNDMGEFQGLEAYLDVLRAETRSRHPGPGLCVNKSTNTFAVRQGNATATADPHEVRASTKALEHASPKLVSQHLKNLEAVIRAAHYLHPALRGLA